MLPGVETSDLRLFAGIGVFVLVNSAIGLWSARRGYSWDSVAFSFAINFLTNVALVLVANLLLLRGGATSGWWTPCSSSSCSAS